MPKGVYERTEEHKRKLGNAHKGKILSDEAKKKIGEKASKRMKIFYAHGGINPMKGRKLSEERIAQMREYGRKNPVNYWLGKKRPPNKWGKHSESSIEKMRQSHKGKSPSIEQRKKLSEALKGEKSYRWKGGITSLNEQIRKSLEYKLWRESVFKRDNYTCIWCGQWGGELQADHIKPFADYLELRFAIDNGRTLCKKCHLTTNTWGARKHIMPSIFSKSF